MIESAHTSQTQAGAGGSGRFTGMRRYISPPLAAQTIAGTIKGQMFGSEASATDNYRMAISVRLLQPDGTERSVLLAPTASDLNATPPELATTSTNRSFLDASESASISLTSQAVTEGDRLVVEVGFSQLSTSVANAAFFFIGANNLSDAAENQTDTTAAATWVEFSQDIQLQKLAPYPVGTTMTPQDTGAAAGVNATATITHTPPAGLQAGDLVVVVCQSRSAATWSVGVDGGQTWTAETAFNNVRIFWCTFNGTWSADPRFDSTSSVCTSSWMNCWRGTGVREWAIDTAQDVDAYGAPGSPFTETRTGITTTHDHCVVLGGFFTLDDNFHQPVNPADDGGWSLTGNVACLRNTSGSDMSMFLAYKAQETAGATGNLVTEQAVVTGDAGDAMIISWYPLPLLGKNWGAVFH
jgi:hypothetical protein